MEQIAKLYGNAFFGTATIATAVNGLRKPGNWLLNPTVFSEKDFVPFETTNEELQATVVQPRKSFRSLGLPNNVQYSGQCQTTVSVQYPTPSHAQSSLICTTSTSHKSKALSRIVLFSENNAPIPSCNLTKPRKPRKHGKTEK